MRIKYILGFLFFINAFASFAQHEKYSRLRIYCNSDAFKRLSSLGIETDHGNIRKNVWLETDLSSEEINKVNAAGFQLDIITDDVQAYYRNQNHSAELSTPNNVTGSGCQAAAPVYPTPAHFNLGSYAGYFTYQEMLNQLDQMANLYPNIITVKAALPGGTTIEGRPIYQVKISDNPNTDEPEPEMLYTAVHHAREPGGMSQLIFYMWYLLEHYGNDPEITAIINNTEMFFVPCVNPDGYLYNELTDPTGGGMWRKNRRDNLDGTYGIDLNRNYGYNWGYDDSGSSPFTVDETYRGDAPFSEPETQLMRDFVNSRNFKIALNYHTFGNLLIYPWGYDYSTYTPDSAQFAEYGSLLTRYNDYTFGTADQTVGYITNGSSDDWMYGEQNSKPKMFSMTPECGDASFGFWPPASEIIPLCENTMFQNITAALLTGRYATVEATGNANITGNGYLNFKVKQLGIDTTGSYTISLSALSTNIINIGPSVSTGAIGSLQIHSDSIAYTLANGIPNGQEIRFLLSINNGNYTRSDTVVRYFGNPAVAYSSNCNTINDFSGQWGISTTQYYSPGASITDSPFGNYSPNDFTMTSTINPVSLANTSKATLSFYAKWEIETNYDFAQVLVSPDNGSTWIPMCGKYTVPGSGFQTSGEPVYEGFNTNWVKEEISLDDFLGQNIQILFTMTSDGWSEYDGFYFDDLTITRIPSGTTTIEEMAVATGNFNIIPNPSHGKFEIKTDRVFKNSKATVSDLTGKVISILYLPEGASQYQTDLSSLDAGVYLIRITDESTCSKPLKVVIQ